MNNNILIYELIGLNGEDSYGFIASDLPMTLISSEYKIYFKTGGDIYQFVDHLKTKYSAYYFKSPTIEIIKLYYDKH